MRIYIFVSILFLSHRHVSGDVEGIRSSILENYDRWVRPVENLNDSVNVECELAVYQLVEFDPKAEMLSTLMWIRLCWDDEYISWDPAQNDGIDLIRMQQDKIWTPDIVPYNDVGTFDTRTYRFLIPLTVKSSGEVCWNFPAPMRTTCIMDVKKFPFDRQECEIIIGSYQYDGNELRVNCKIDGIDADDFTEHSQWALECKNVKF